MDAWLERDYEKTVERLNKENKMFREWINKLQVENDELKHRLKYKIFDGLEDSCDQKD